MHNYLYLDFLAFSLSTYIVSISMATAQLLSGGGQLVLNSKINISDGTAHIGLLHYKINNKQNEIILIRAYTRASNSYFPDYHRPSWPR